MSVDQVPDMRVVRRPKGGTRTGTRTGTRKGKPYQRMVSSMTKLVTSTAHVSTDRPGRYAKQLASHFSRKIETDWDAEAGTGKLVFPETDEGLAPATCSLTQGEGELVLTLETVPERLEQMEAVVARHLVMFGTKDELVVEWSRG